MARLLISTSLDTEADALYITLRKGTIARTEELDDDTFVDLDAQGVPLGIEVMHPARTWPLQVYLERYRVAGEERALLEQLVPSAAREFQPPFTRPAVELAGAAAPLAVATG
jgi:uncharacterized protein YuzE